MQRTRPRRPSATGATSPPPDESPPHDSSETRAACDLHALPHLELDPASPRASAGLATLGPASGSNVVPRSGLRYVAQSARSPPQGPNRYLHAALRPPENSMARARIPHKTAKLAHAQFPGRSLRPETAAFISTPRDRPPHSKRRDHTSTCPETSPLPQPRSPQNDFQTAGNAPRPRPPLHLHRTTSRHALHRKTGPGLRLAAPSKLRTPNLPQLTRTPPQAPPSTVPKS